MLLCRQSTDGCDVHRLQLTYSICSSCLPAEPCCPDGLRLCGVQHWSNRSGLDRRKTLWGSWAIHSHAKPGLRFWFAGESAHCYACHACHASCIRARSGAALLSWQPVQLRGALLCRLVLQALGCSSIFVVQQVWHGMAYADGPEHCFKNGCGCQVTQDTRLSMLRLGAACHPQT